MMPLRQEVFVNTGDLVGYILRGSYGFRCLRDYGSSSFFLERGRERTRSAHAIRRRANAFQRKRTTKEVGCFHATSVVFK